MSFRCQYKKNSLLTLHQSHAPSNLRLIIYYRHINHIVKTCLLPSFNTICRHIAAACYWLHLAGHRWRGVLEDIILFLFLIIFSVNLFLQPTLMHNSITTRMSDYYPRHVSGLDMPILRRNNCTNTASGILALLRGSTLHRLRADCREVCSQPV